MIYQSIKTFREVHCKHKSLAGRRYYKGLRLIQELKKLGWPVIIGCHVGETSLLTRAALIPAYAAGENLIAQEGAFGDYLVEREPVDPILKFGRNGMLDLSQPYYLKTVQGLRLVPTENWDIGFGMECRIFDTPDDGRPDILFLEMPDKYKIHYRKLGRHRRRGCPGYSPRRYESFGMAGPPCKRAT